MGKIGNKKIGRVKYPNKTSINLAIQDQSGDNKFPIVLFVIFLIILALFVKFMVVDKLTEAYQARQKYEQMQSSITQFQEHTKDYEKVKAEHSHYGNGYLNDEERAEQDRIAMINLINRKVIPQASIQSLDISGNVATLTIDKTILSTVSKVVASLEESGIVSFVNVTTAGTNTEKSTLITATMTINFKRLGGEQ